MNFSNLVHDHTGLFHLIVSIIALIAGTIVLANKKGTPLHKKAGYVYFVAMVSMLISAFMLYNLFGKIGIFHWLAVLSSITLLGGMMPMILKKPTANYVILHISLMYWSVIGLYAAFFAETIVRIPFVFESFGFSPSTFFTLTGFASGTTIAIGIFYWIKLKPKWYNQFVKTK